MENEASSEREFTVWWRQTASEEWVAQFQDSRTGECFTVHDLSELKLALASPRELEAAGDEEEGEGQGMQVEQRGA